MNEYDIVIHVSLTKLGRIIYYARKSYLLYTIITVVNRNCSLDDCKPRPYKHVSAY